LSTKYQNTIDTLRANTLFVLLALIFGAWLAWDAAFFRLVTFAPLTAYWEHAAVLNEWLQNFESPTNPHVDDPSLSIRFIPLFRVLAYIGPMFNLGAVELMSISALLNYALIVLGLQLFLKSYFRNPWAPLIGFISIFLCWGVGETGPNLYQLHSFFYVAGFPSSFVFGVSLISFYVTLRLLRRDGSTLLLASVLCLLSALMLVSDPITGLFGMSGCILLAITESYEVARLRLLVIIALIAGALFAETWPYFSVWTFLLGLYGPAGEQLGLAAGLVELAGRLRLGEVVATLGPALIGVPLCVWLFVRRDYLFIVFGAICMAIPYLLQPFVEVPFAHRFLLFVATYFHLAIVWCALEIIEAWSSRPRPAYAGPMLCGLVGVVFSLLVANVVLLSNEFGMSGAEYEASVPNDRQNKLSANLSIVDIYSRLAEPLAEDSIVLAVPAEGWPLPTIKAKLVSIYHDSPMLPDQRERFVATVRFFYEPQTESQRAMTVVNYNATHVLLKGEPKISELGVWLGAHAELVSSAGDYRVYSLRDSAMAAFTPSVPASESNLHAGIIAPSKSISAAATAKSAAERLPVARRVLAPAIRETTRTEQVPEAGTFGAPIPPPLIGVMPPETVPEKGTAGTVLQEEAPVVITPTPAPVRPEPKAATKEEPEGGVYGAPIGTPVLDPLRHGAE
jgi:hypothetical protein